MNADFVMMVSLLFWLAILFFLFAHLHRIDRQTKRMADAAESLQKWVEWAARQKGQSGV